MCVRKPRLSSFIGDGISAVVDTAASLAIDNGRRAACVTVI